MSDPDTTQRDETSDFGCWALMAIAVILLLALIVGFLVLV
jgi:hypothetical protein